MSANSSSQGGSRRQKLYELPPGQVKGIITAEIILGLFLVGIIIFGVMALGDADVDPGFWVVLVGMGAILIILMLYIALMRHGLTVYRDRVVINGRSFGKEQVVGLDVTMRRERDPNYEPGITIFGEQDDPYITYHKFHFTVREGFAEKRYWVEVPYEPDEAERTVWELHAHLPNLRDHWAPGSLGRIF